MKSYTCFIKHTYEDKHLYIYFTTIPINKIVRDGFIDLFHSRLCVLKESVTNNYNGILSHRDRRGLISPGITPKVRSSR